MLDKIKESTPTTNWRLGLKEVDSDKYMLWNLETFKLFQESLTALIIN